MTLIGDWADISEGHAVPTTVGNLIGFRACLGASFVDADFAAQFAEAKHRYPDAVTLDYIFLAGPKRSNSAIPAQIAFYANTHKADLSCLDWEEDTYQDPITKETIDLGIQPFAAVSQAIDESRKHGLNPGVYGPRDLFTVARVTALLAKKVPFLWVAAFDGLSLPTWLVAACANAGVMLFHQYTGTALDRSRTLVGSLEGLHALAGRPVQQEAKVKFIQLSSADVAALPSLQVPANTPIEDFAGTQWTTIGPTSVHVLPGLVDAHSNRRAVVISTGRFYADGVQRPTAQIAVLS